MYSDEDRAVIFQIRQQFQKQNEGHVRDRVKLTEPVEDWILEMMNAHGVPVRGRLVRGWEKCSAWEDKTLKRDAYAFLDGVRIYAQIKHRQPGSGDDIGLSLIEPYVATREQMRWLSPNEMPWGRDLLFDGDIYVELSGNAWDTLYVVDFQQFIKPLATGTLKEWLEDPDGFDLKKGISYTSTKHPGCQLCYKLDAGRGYRENTPKILCYIKPGLVLPHGVAIEATLPSPRLLQVFGVNTEVLV